MTHEQDESNGGWLDLSGFGAHLRARGVTYALVALLVVTLLLHERAVGNLISAQDRRDGDRVQAMQAIATAMSVVSSTMVRLESDAHEHATLDQMRFARFEALCGRK